MLAASEKIPKTTSLKLHVVTGAPAPSKHAAVLGPIKAKPWRVAAKLRPALFVPASRRRLELAIGAEECSRGADRTKAVRRSHLPVDIRWFHSAGYDQTAI